MTPPASADSAPPSSDSPQYLDDADVKLMLRVQQGDHGAFAELLQRNHRRVLGLAYRYLGDRARAEDIAQESFLKVYQARERYKPNGRFSSYVLRITANLCLSKLRRKKVLQLNPDGEEGQGVEPEDPQARRPEEGMLEEELAVRVREAVDRLPDRQRMAILLNKFEGLDYQQVAEHLELSPAATKSLLHRARMTLKDMLSGYLGTELT